jgi:hypothetical protein
VIPHGGTCAVPASWLPVPIDGAAAGGDSTSGVVCKVAELGVDADFQFYQAYGSSVGNVQNRVNSVINGLNVQYENQVGIRHDITQIIIRTSSGTNPYTTNDPVTLLNQFRNHWNSNHGSVQRDVAHLFTGRNLSGSTIGIAFLGVICNLSNAYGLVQNTSNFNCAKDLSAHELGHNWNADHCSCPSSTMNPSLTCANTFLGGGSNSVNQIVAFRNSRWCLTNCQPPAPFNDLCQDVLFVGPGQTPFTNISAGTDGPSEPGTCNISGDSNIQRDVWFGIFAECNGVATISVCSADYAAKLGVYGGDCPTSSGSILACDLTSCPGVSRPQVTLEIFAGNAYVIRVGGHLGAQGNGTLSVNIECAEPACEGDFNNDGAVDVFDLLELLGAWGPCFGCPQDLDGSGAVDVFDLLTLLGAWGSCP